MSIQIATNQYGKARVRLVKVERHADQHDLREITVQIAFSGDYEQCYITGDNGRILPTDTMKNTVYALAKQAPLDSVEAFGKRLAAHFLENNPALHQTQITLEETRWSRLNDHAFEKGSDEKRTTAIQATREGVTVTSGLKDLVLLKTTNSSFYGYIKDPYTTLKEATDRIFATSITATWIYTQTDLPFDKQWARIRQSMVDAFAAHQSLSVQHTLYAMGEAVLSTAPEVEQISLTLPNKHCLLVDLRPFGMENPNEVFLPVDEPHGLIEATLRRS